MQRIQRKFGAFLPRTPNESQVGSLLKDFEEAEQMLTNIVEGAKQWRDAWTNILSHQLNMLTELEALYKPIAGSSEPGPRQPVETPEQTLERTARLRQAYQELKEDMVEEVNKAETRLVMPAKEARDNLKPMKKIIKKREDKKLDYERYQSRVDALRNKSKRSDRENTALAKHEADLTRTTDEYQMADEHLRNVLPGIVNGVFSLVPHLLATQIEIQNTLLGHVYTTLQNYCVEFGFPSPPPELDEVVGPWESEFSSLRLELEGSFQMLANGKAIHQPMRQPDKSGTLTGLNIRNTVMGRRQNSQTSTKPASAPKYNLSAPAYDGVSPPAIDSGSKPKIGGLGASRPKTESYSPNASVGSLTPYGQTTTPSPRLSSTSLSSQGDYFARPRIPSATSSASQSPGISPGLGKKKPPPPPPPKKIGSFHSEYVTAMYDFEPINEGDLAFKEGDRIRVIKKTQSSQDWWEGEVNGQRGSFPANYCK